MTCEHLNTDRIIINGYSRSIEDSTDCLQIPEIIKDIVYHYCDPWWNDLNPSPIKISHCSFYSNGIPHLSYYYSQSLNKERIIVSSFANDAHFVYEYDINNDTFNVLCKYPQNFDPQCHVQIIDEKNELLYIYFGRNDNFGILNLINNEWDIKLYNNNDFNMYNILHNVNNSTSYFIQSPIEQLHILHHVTSRQIHHYYYKSDEEMFIRIDCTSTRFRCGEIVYVQRINKLLSIRGYSFQNTIAHVYYCDIVADATTKHICSNYKWKIFNGLKLPFKARKPECIVAMNAILMVMKNRYVDQGEIWYVDVGDETETGYKWFKSDILIKNPTTKRMVITKNNYIHFIDFYNDNEEETLSHSKIHLSHLIHHGLFTKYA